MQNLTATPLRKAALAIGLSGALVALAAIAFVPAAPAGYGPKLKAKLKTKRVIATSNAAITGADNPQRFEVYCPSGMRPLGGGMLSSPPPDANGAGAFSVSYERLGAQDGWHISATQAGRGGSTSLTIQAMCRKYSGNIDPVQHFVKSQEYTNIGPGKTKRFTETCPRGKRLVTGGYLSAQFTSQWGAYVTESRAADSRSWTVLATGVPGGPGGQVSAIAYCYRSKKPLLAEITSAPATVAPGVAGTATATGCPGGKQLIAGGYSAPSTVRVVDGGFQDLDTWVASAANTGGGQITAYGYCL